LRTKVDLSVKDVISFERLLINLKIPLRFIPIKELDIHLRTIR
jgi:hypothetical protein